MLPGGVSGHQVVLPVMQPTDWAAGYSKTSVPIYWIMWHHGFNLILTDLRTLNINSLFLYSFFCWMISFLVISLSSIWNCPYVGVSQSMKEALWFHCVYLKQQFVKSHTYYILLQNVNIFIMPCTLGWPYTEGTWVCCDYFIWVYLVLWLY